MALERWFHAWPGSCLCFIVLVSGTTANTTTARINGTATPPPLGGITTSGNTGGLQSADIAAIVLGCLLVCLIVLAVLVCVLYNKARVDNISNEKRHVIPGVPAFSATSNSIRRLSMEAINKARQQQHLPSANATQQPIVYMQNDIYYPPNSRPLPWNNVSTEPYEERVNPVTMPRQQKHRKDKTSLRSTGKRRRPPLPSTGNHRRSQVPPDGNHVIVTYPGDAKMDFTFNGSPAPYNDWKKPYNTA